MLDRIVALLAITSMVLVPLTASAESARAMVDKGNAAFSSGKYDQALEAYDKAAVEMPEAAAIYFNRGAAYYRQENYSKAAEAFEQATLKSKTTDLEAKSRFNLGLCSFREAERQKDSDLNKALEACETSIRHFQETLKLKPDFKHAAENIEVVRLTMKSILDAINKQKEAAQNKQEALRKTAEQIKQLIEKQQSLLDQNSDLSAEKAEKGDAENLQSKMSDLSDDQKRLAQKTTDTAEKLPAPTTAANKAQQAAPDPVKNHLENAASEQHAASEKLAHSQTGPAHNDQQKALDELKNALAALNNGKGAPQADNKGNQPEGQRPENTGKDKKKEKTGQQESPSAATRDRQQDQKTNRGKQPAQIAQIPDDVHQILDEERKNKNARNMDRTGGFNDVDKDW